MVYWDPSALEVTRASFTRLKYTFSFCFFVHVIVYFLFFFLRMQADNFDQFHRRYPKALLHNPFSLWQLRPLQVYVVHGGNLSFNRTADAIVRTALRTCRFLTILLAYRGILYTRGHLVVIWRSQKSAL